MLPKVSRVAVMLFALVVVACGHLARVGTELEGNCWLSCWAQPNPPRLDYGQPALETVKDAGLLYEAFDQPQNERRGGIPWQFQNDDAIVKFRRVIANIGEPEVAGGKTSAMIQCVPCDRRIFGTSQTNIANSNRLVAMPFQ